MECKMAIETRQIRLTLSQNAQQIRLVTSGMNYDQVRVVTGMNTEQFNPSGGMNCPDVYRVINPQDVPSEFQQYIH